MSSTLLKTVFALFNEMNDHSLQSEKYLAAFHCSLRDKENKFHTQNSCNRWGCRVEGCFLMGHTVGILGVKWDSESVYFLWSQERS
jgi:hypothetical protein